MSTLKARFTDAQAQAFIATYDPQADHIERLDGGESSQAFAFVSEGQSLVLRVNHHAPYATEVWLCDRLQTSPVPVPAVLQHGSEPAFHWAISRRAPGVPAERLDIEGHRAILPDLLETLHVIHQQPVNDLTGYGAITPSGRATHDSWQQYLATEALYGSFVDWDSALASATERQRALIRGAWEAAQSLFPLCPEDRVLTHNDFSLDNIITDGHSVTGVIDWSNAVLGDPLRDVAWLDFWAPELGVAPAWLAIHPTAHATERIRCYQLLLAAGSLGFYLHTQQPASATWAEDRFHHLLSN